MFPLFHSSYFISLIESRLFLCPLSLPCAESLHSSPFRVFRRKLLAYGTALSRETYGNRCYFHNQSCQNATSSSPKGFLDCLRTCTNLKNRYLASGNHGSNWKTLSFTRKNCLISDFSSSLKRISTSFPRLVRRHAVVFHFVHFISPSRFTPHLHVHS